MARPLSPREAVDAFPVKRRLPNLRRVQRSSVIAQADASLCHGHVAISRYPSAKFILYGQAVGFSCLIALVWTVELLHLPHRFFGDSIDGMWPRIGLRTAVLLGIWFLVHMTTSRLLRRLHELETYLRLCAWCRKVDDAGEWRTLEEYFENRFNTDTSHGICPACATNHFPRQPSAARVPPAANAGRSPASKP